MVKISSKSAAIGNAIEMLRCYGCTKAMYKDVDRDRDPTRPSMQLKKRVVIIAAAASSAALLLRRVLRALQGGFDGLDSVVSWSSQIIAGMTPSHHETERP